MSKEKKMRVLISAVLAFAAMLAPALARDFQLESFFKGRTYAYGKFWAINGSSRAFKVILNGSWNGKVLRLREDFIYADGEKDTKTWIFRKTSPTTYLGTREDVVGQTLVTVSGREATFTYDVDLTPKTSPTMVRFHDTLALQPDGTLFNTAWVTKFGFPVARVKVNFARNEAVARAIQP
jgi:Protein of unknown function (DUF3833)